MFAKNIRYLRRMKEWTQDELAKKIGYKSFVTVSKWELGESRPRATEMEKLSQLFGVSINDLINSDLEHGKSNDTGSSIRINVYGSVPAGIPTEAIENIVDWEDIPKEWISGGREYFGLKVKGDSMYPKYMEGDTIIVRKQSYCESGQDCIVYVNGFDATLKDVTTICVQESKAQPPTGTTLF